MSGSSYMYGSSVASGKRRSGKGLFSPVQMKLLSQSKSVYDGNLGTEFQSEVQVLARIEHLNLVRCLGYLVHEEERLVIVEYDPNRTLRENLDGLRGSQLDLASRLDITIDVAHAITYFHMYIVTPNNKMKNKDFKPWLSPNKSSKIVPMTLLFVVVCGFSFYLGGIYDSEKSSYSTKNVGSSVHSRKETGASPLQIKPLAFVECSIDYQDYPPYTNPKRWSKYGIYRLILME